MAIRLHLEQDLEEKKESVLHLLPCKIHGDDTAKVSSYFEPYIRKIDDEHYDASFRGYPLQGKRVTVPSGYRGIIFYERKKPLTDKEKRNLYSTGSFSEFTYWNYDKLPSKNDAIAAAFDWLDIAEALHSTDT